jgi:hypothetical protein
MTVGISPVQSALNSFVSGFLIFYWTDQGKKTELIYLSGRRSFGLYEKSENGVKYCQYFSLILLDCLVRFGGELSLKSMKRTKDE